MSRTVIAVDLDTMRELADEETRVRSEKTSCYSFRDHAVVGKLVKDAQEALAALQRYALAETTK